MARQYAMPGYSREGPPRTLMVILAAALLLFMQSLVLQHQQDLDHHHDGEPCELCLHLAPLDHGLVDTQILPPSPQAFTPPATHLLQHTYFPFHFIYFSRAPPSLS